jgi:hypothetical protein
LIRWLGASLLLIFAGTASGVDTIELAWGVIDGGAWRGEDVELILALGDSAPMHAALRIGRLETVAGAVTGIELQCSELRQPERSLDCAHGRLRFASDWLNADDAAVSFRYAPDTGALDATLRQLPLAGGTARLVLHQQADGWRLQATFDAARLEELAALAARVGVKLPKLDVTGSAGGTFTVSGGRQGLKQADWQLHTDALGYSNAEGSQAGEALQLRSRGSATRAGADWQVQASLDARQGMLYSDPLYLEFSPAQPLQLEAGLRWQANGELQVQSLSFDRPGVMQGALQGRLAPGAAQPLREVRLQLDRAVLPGFYSNWLQPWLAGTVADELDTGGEFGAAIHIVDGRPQSLRLRLDEVSFGERNGLFGVQALSGELNWDDSEAVYDSHLGWQGAHFHQLLLGPAQMRLQTGHDSMQLREPLSVALLDGELQIAEFELGRNEQGLRWLLDARLTPVSMQAFSNALGWPTMGGTLSGAVPKVRYENGELKLGGSLVVDVFDGRVAISNLRIRQPLGRVPRLWADAWLRELDLETLTRTFSFGRIEGRLQGEVRNLYTEAWQLVAFDAHFETPPDDDSRHRISQKAVDNISNLGGGGVSGAVSRSFLRFFEDFPYKRLGISCRLQNGVCAMGGVAPANGGYYLVQGRWLPPRLDVIGYSERVDWHSLLDRLAAVTSGQAPVVK